LLRLRSDKLNIHIYPSTFANETRILKIVRSLRRNLLFSDVIVLALWKEGLPRQEPIEDGIQILRVAPVAGINLGSALGRVIKAVGWYLGVLLVLRGRQVTCLNCHSLPVLPLSVIVKWWKGCVLIYEPHELETETAGLRGLRRKLARLVERSLIRFADAVCVVNRSIADWYEAAYGLRDLHVVRNVPHRKHLAPERTGLLRRAIGLGPDSLLFLYQGLLAPGRGVDVLLTTFTKMTVDRHLVFMGYGELADRIGAASISHNNIHYLPAVPPDQLQRYTVDADVGISLIENVCLSYRLCLPNKLFEYAACGLPSVVSNFPEMAAFVDRYRCGWCIEPTSEELFGLASGLTAETIALRRDNALRASEVFCWQNEEAALLLMYQQLGFPFLGGADRLADKMGGRELR
jgi:glycosyltransferase involved in cell wall biosynthesis